MGNVVVSQFITLDGVFEDPGGAEGLDRGGWAFKFERGEDGDSFKLDEVMEATRCCSDESPTRASRRRGRSATARLPTSSTGCRSTSPRGR